MYSDSQSHSLQREIRRAGRECEVIFRLILLSEASIRDFEISRGTWNDAQEFLGGLMDDKVDSLDDGEFVDHIQSTYSGMSVESKYLK